MPAATERIEFAPPPAPGRLPALLLAIFAHILLMLALTWGITWNRESENMSAEAELWASVPREAAPTPVAPPTPPVVQAPPLPQPVPQPVPPPAVAEPKVQPPPAKQPDIALEREKRKQEEAQRQREETEREKKIEARKKQEELDRQKKIEARKQELEKKRQEEQAKALKAKQEAQRLEALRKEQLERMQRLATGSGRPDDNGVAERSAGPSESYAGRIRARVRPNIVFADDVPGNPTAEVEVRLAPDGTITSRRLTRSSGIGSWDEAVLRALDKTEILPRDIDGRVHTPMIIAFRPKG